MGVITLIYDHHAGRIAERLTELQHGHLEQVVTTTHVHLDERRCLEVILLRGSAGHVRELADKLIGTKGVETGRLVLTAAHRSPASALQRQDMGTRTIIMNTVSMPNPGTKNTPIATDRRAGMSASSGHFLSTVPSCWSETITSPSPSASRNICSSRLSMISRRFSRRLSTRSLSCLTLASSLAISS